MQYKPHVWSGEFIDLIDHTLFSVTITNSFNLLLKQRQAILVTSMNDREKLLFFIESCVSDYVERIDSFSPSVARGLGYQGQKHSKSMRPPTCCGALSF